MMRGGSTSGGRSVTIWCWGSTAGKGTPGSLSPGESEFESTESSSDSSETIFFFVVCKAIVCTYVS